MQPYLSYVIPVYNGANTITSLCNDLIRLSESFHWDYEIILVDDFSKDHSRKVLTDLSENNSAIKSIFLSENFGQQNALFCGLNFVTGHYVVTLDDDGQHPVFIIPQLLEKIKTGFHTVYAVTDVQYEQFYRNLGSKLTDKVFTYLLRKPKDKRISSFRIMEASLVEKIVDYPYRYVYLSASIIQCTKKIDHLYYNKKPRIMGQSNYTFMKQFRLFSRIIIYYAPIPFLALFRKKGLLYHIERTINI